MLTVAEIFTQCQETVGAHSKYAKMLWDVEAASSDDCFRELSTCVTYLLTVPLVGMTFPWKFLSAA